MVEISAEGLVEYIVLDFETTGLYPKRHRVIEVAAAHIKNKEIVNTYSCLCNPSPGKKLSPFIIKFTGITDEMLVGQPNPSAIMATLKTFIADLPIVALIA
jgi:DNA polymerase III alpha subunit (gram-positive type)